MFTRNHPPGTSRAKMQGVGIMRSIFARFLIVGFTIPFSITSSMSAEKTDIKGFQIGATALEVQQKTAGLKCYPRNCDLEDGGTIELTISSFIDKPILKAIVYEFKSGTAPAIMIDQISKQFDMKLNKSNNKADIAFAMSRRVGFDEDFGRIVTKVGGRIATWRSSLSRRTLDLTVNEPGPPTEYILTLRDEKLFADDDIALSQKKTREDAERRAINPHPKF